MYSSKAYLVRKFSDCDATVLEVHACIVATSFSLLKVCLNMVYWHDITFEAVVLLPYARSAYGTIIESLMNLKNNFHVRIGNISIQYIPAPACVPSFYNLMESDQGSLHVLIPS